MAEIVYHLYESAHNFNDGVNTAVNLIPQQWNRFTVTDGLAFTENTLSALHYRDVYLANVIESVSSELTNKYSAGLGIYINTATNTISRNIAEDSYKFSKEFGIVEDTENYNVSLNISHENNHLGFSAGKLAYISEQDHLTGWIDYNNEEPKDKPQTYPVPTNTGTLELNGGASSISGGISAEISEFPNDATMVYVDYSKLTSGITADFGGPERNYAKFKKLNVNGIIKTTDIVTSAITEIPTTDSFNVFNPTDKTKYEIMSTEISGGSNYVTDTVDMVPDNVFFVW